MARPRIRTENGIRIYKKEDIVNGRIRTYEFTRNIDGLETLHGNYTIKDMKTNVLMETGKYRKGNRTGVRKIYKLNKDNEPYLYAEISYRGGKRSGTSIGNYECGSLRYIMNFTGNKIFGTSVAFSSDGKVIMTLSTTVTNKTTMVSKRVGLVKNEFRYVHGTEAYKDLMKTVKTYFNDGTE